MAVSVVVPTFRRPDGLRRLLNALAAETIDGPWEVVVVDNDPASDGEAARILAAQPFPAQVAARCVVEPRPGATAARNRGIGEATGRVVAMLDDDVVPEPGWLPAVIAPTVEDPDVVAVGGKVVLDPAVPRPPWWTDGVGGYLTSHDLGPSNRDLADHEILVTANAAVRRDALLHIGGFDETFGPRAGVQLVADDARLTRMLRRLPAPPGGRLVWRPGAAVVHELPAQRLRRRWLLRRAWWQGRSDWMLERLDHPGRRYGGARVAAVEGFRWWRNEWAARCQEWRAAPQSRRSPILLHAACDAVRLTGWLTEAAAGLRAVRGERLGER